MIEDRAATNTPDPLSQSLQRITTLLLIAIIFIASILVYERLRLNRILAVPLAALRDVLAGLLRASCQSTRMYGVHSTVTIQYCVRPLLGNCDESPLWSWQSRDPPAVKNEVQERKG